MSMVACVIAVIALLMLFGQYLAGTADYYLAVENPRPLDDNLEVITIYLWGFASGSKAFKADLAGQGFADVRFFATRKQVLLSLVTCGAIRPISVAWRGNAGQHPLGQA